MLLSTLWPTAGDDQLRLFKAGARELDLPLTTPVGVALVRGARPRVLTRAVFPASLDVGRSGHLSTLQRRENGELTVLLVTVTTRATERRADSKRLLRRRLR